MSWRACGVWAALPLLLALACSPADEGAVALAPDVTPTSAPAVDTPGPTAAPLATGRDDVHSQNYTPTGPPPPLDVDTASVSLGEVLFDTFRGGYIPLPDASDTVIEQLRDAIKPIYVPAYDPVRGGDWLGEGDMVIGYAAGSVAYAYPLKILNLHEIVHDYIDGVPVLVSYCPLCASAVVYDRRLDGEDLVFGNTSALYESDMVMYDHQTGSYWLQVLGEAIIGSLTDRRLTMLPSMTVAWGEWKRHHPDTLVLSADQRLPGYEGNPYRRDSTVGFGDRINESGPVFPTRPITDLRLRPGDRVIAIQVGDSHKAYPLAADPIWLLNDNVGGRDVLILGRGGAGSPSAAAYFRQVSGDTLSFKIRGELVEDQETRTVWDDTGLAVSGPLAGARLDQVPSRTSFWFSMASALPDIELHRP